MSLDEKKLRKRYEKRLKVDFNVLYPNRNLSELEYEVIERIVLKNIPLTDKSVIESLGRVETPSLHLSVFSEYPFITEYWGLSPSQITNRQAEMLVAGQDIYSVLGQPKDLGPLEQIELDERLESKRKRINTSRRGSSSLRVVSTKRGLKDPTQAGRTYGGHGGGEGR